MQIVATLLNNTIVLPAVLYFVVVLRYAVVQALRWCFVGRSVVNHVIVFKIPIFLSFGLCNEEVIKECLNYRAHFTLSQDLE
jgi:hypothetical protein